MSEAEDIESDLNRLRQRIAVQAEQIERLKEALEPFAVENPIGILDPWMQYFSAARALLAELSK